MNRNLLIIILSGFFFRSIIAFFNLFFNTLGGRDDTHRFHNCGGFFAGYKTDEYYQFICMYFYTNNFFEGFYVQNFLSFFYLVVGHNKYFGNLFSCFAWLLSALILVKILNILAIRSKYMSYSLIFYSFIPSSIFYTSVILREPFQLLLINLSILFFVNILYENKNKYFFFLFSALFFLSTFHRTFIFYVIFLVLLFLLFYTIKSKSWLLGIPLIAIASFFGYYIIINSSIIDAFGDGFFEAFVNFQEGAVGRIGRITGRAQYTFLFPTIDNIFDFLFKFLPKNFLKYFLEPIPLLRSISFIDFLLVLENFIRFILLLFCFKNFILPSKNTRSNTRFIFLFIFISYVCLEAMWSVGTVNWGTASRHHIPSYGLLAILAFFIPKKMNIISYKLNK